MWEVGEERLEGAGGGRRGVRVGDLQQLISSLASSQWTTWSQRLELEMQLPSLHWNSPALQRVTGAERERVKRSCEQEEINSQGQQVGSSNVTRQHTKTNTYRHTHRHTDRQTHRQTHTDTQTHRLTVAGQLI